MSKSSINPITQKQKNEIIKNIFTSSVSSLVNETDKLMYNSYINNIVESLTEDMGKNDPIRLDFKEKISEKFKTACEEKKSFDSKPKITKFLMKSLGFEPKYKDQIRTIQNNFSDIITPGKSAIKESNRINNASNTNKSTITSKIKKFFKNNFPSTQPKTSNNNLDTQMKYSAPYSSAGIKQKDQKNPTTTPTSLPNKKSRGR